MQNEANRMREKIIEQENQLLKIKHVTAIGQTVKHENRIEH